MISNPFSRRMLLGLFGTGAAATVADAGSTSSATAPAAVTRATLPQRPAVAGAAWQMIVGGRSERWLWQAGDFASSLRADPRGGLVIAHATVPPSSGAWVRDWDGLTGRAEWFGARADDPAFDNQPAIQAAVDLCPSVQLGPGQYHVARCIRITRNGARLIGAGITQTDQGPNEASTQIVSSSSSETIVQIGVDDARQPASLTECVQLRDVTVRRAVAPYTPPSGIEGAVGIAMRWCVNCHVERVFSIDSARGWLMVGTVENYVMHCSALRRQAGSNRANDVFVGFHLDFRPSLGGNAGNASLYIDHCRVFGAFDGQAPTFAYSAGLRTDGGWVDLYIESLETGAVQFGVDGYGDRYDGGTSFRTQDLTIRNGVFDATTQACIRLQHADASSAVQIIGNYLCVTPSGTCVVLNQLNGSVALTANQCIIGGVGGTGLSAIAVNNLRSANNIFTKLKQPVWLERVAGFDLADTINSRDPGNPLPAISLTACTRGTVDCIVGGPATASGGGVQLIGQDNRGIEVCATKIDSGTFAKGSVAKLRNEASPITRPGPFGNNCLATGIFA